MSFKRNFFKNIITFGGYNYIGQALSFLSSIVLSRYLTPSEYGFVALITVFTGFIIMFSDAGLSYAVIRSDYGRTFHHALNNLSGFIGILLFLIMIILAYPISLFYENPDLILPTIVLSSIFIINSLKVVPQAILTKNLEFNTIGQINLYSVVLLIGLMILFAILGFSYWALIIPQIIADLFKCIMFYKKAKFRFTLNAFYKMKLAFNKAKSLIGNLSIFNMIDYWTRTADNLIIGKFYDTDSLGLYNRGYRLLQMSTSIITGIFGTVLFPSLKKHQSEGGDVNKEYEDILGIISLLSFPIALVLILIPKQLTVILWSETWIGAADFLPYFGLLVLSQTLIFTTGNIFILLKKEKIFMRLGVIMSSLVVGSIVVGAFFSVLHIIRFYTLFYLIAVIPIVLYVGFYKSFSFPVKRILRFWLLKLVLSVSLVFSIWFGTKLYSSILLGLYFIHLIFFQRKEIIAFFGILKNRILKIFNK
ncbi:hypothetical protein ES705_20753 [subsurface metagenome]